MTRKERIYQYLKSKEYIPLNFDELITVLDVPKEDGEALLSILNELINEQKVFITKKGRYMPVTGAPETVIGTISCNGRGYFAFLLPEGEGQDDVYINGDNLADALDSDKVLVQIDKTDDKTHRREGHVLKVLERGNTALSGVVEKEKNGTYRIRCDRERIYTKIRVLPEHMMEAKLDDRVIVELTEYTPEGKVYGMVTKVLGGAGELSSMVEAILFEHGVKQEFDEETIAHSESVPDAISPEEIENRVDYREKTIFTIDGDDARDFDDAVSIEKLDNGNYSLGVYIADVTHYVTEGSALDREAFERGTSVYLADRVVPMLPKRLSNGICSLNPNVDRLTLSVTMEIDASGQVKSHRLEKSVIRSVERMTYGNVTKLLEGTDEKLLHRYAHILQDLKQMELLAAILRKRRMARGSIDFNFPESEVIVNEQGEPVDIARVERQVSHRMIEEFMLVANETVAEYAYWSDIPFVYRVHEPPSTEKMEQLNRFLSNFGIMIKGKIDEDNPVHPKSLEQILEKIKDMPEERIISTYMLRSLMKARYTPQNLGHFGLAAKYYTHFTSPIRRYPDLSIHRILKELIDGKLDDRRVGELENFVAQSAENSSEREVEAEGAERDVDDLMKAAYMAQFVGETFEGVISSVTNFGIFVELENSVEGLIRLENIKSDYYEFDDTQKRLVGERTKRIFKVGDSVHIVVIRTDVQSRQIDFLLAEDADEKSIEKAIKKTENRKIDKKAKAKSLEREKGKQTRQMKHGVKKKKKGKKS